MGRLTKGFLLGAASVLGAYYYKNPQEAQKHKELVLENAKKLLDKVNNLELEETNKEVSELEEAQAGVLETAELPEAGIKLQAKDEVEKEETKDEKLDSLLSAFEPQEEEVAGVEEKSSTSKAGLVAGAGVLGGAAVAGTLLSSDKDEVEAEEVSTQEEPVVLDHFEYVDEEEPVAEKAEELKAAAETKVEEVKEQAVELKDAAVEKTEDLKAQAVAKTEEVQENALDLKDQALEKSQELSEEAQSEGKVSTGLLAGAAAVGGAAVAGVVGSQAEAQEANEEVVARAEETKELATEKAEELKAAAETKVEEVKEQAVELKDAAVEKTEDLKAQAVAKTEEVQENALDLKDQALEKSQELSEEAQSEGKVSTGLLAGAAAVGGAAVAGVVGSQAEAQEANEEVVARAEETKELATEKVEELKATAETKVEEVKEQVAELKDSAVANTEFSEEELLVEEYTTEDEDELARLDREIAELEAQIRAEQGDSEVLHSFDLSDANVTEADLAEETTEFTYEEAELTPEDELVQEEVASEETEESNSIFGRIKSIVSGEKDAQSTVEEVSSLKDDVTNLSVEDLKAELGESTGLVRGPLDEVQGQVEDAKAGVLNKVNLNSEENLVDQLKSKVEDVETSATETVEEKKSGIFGALGSLFTSKK